MVPGTGRGCVRTSCATWCWTACARPAGPISPAATCARPASAAAPACVSSWTRPAARACATAAWPRRRRSRGSCTCCCGWRRASTTTTATRRPWRPCSTACGCPPASRPGSGAGVQALVPLGDPLGLGRQQGPGIALDGDPLDLVARLYGVHHRLVGLTLDLAEDGVAAVQPGGGDMGDEELAAIGAGAGIGHGQLARGIVAQVRADLVLEAVARAAGAGAARAAALDQEIGDHPVEVQAVVEAAPGQVDEAGHGHRGLLGEQAQADRAAGGGDDGGQGHDGLRGWGWGWGWDWGRGWGSPGGAA